MKISIAELAKCAVLAMAIVPSDAKAWTESTTFKDTTVLVSDNHVALICGTYNIPVAIANPTTKQILINQPFTLLARRVQIAILYHEYAHLKLKHKMTIIDLLKRIIHGGARGKQLQYELEADAYSVKKGYGKELRMYLRYINYYISLEPIPEITTRIEAIQKGIKDVQKTNL